MHRTPFLLSVALAATLASFLVGGCGGSGASSPDDSGAPGADATAPGADAQPTPGEDSGPSTDASLDGGPGNDMDSGPLADARAGDATAPDASGTLPGILVATGAGVSMVGFTTDERLIYQTSAGVFALGRDDAGTDSVTTPAAPDDAGARQLSIGQTGVFLRTPTSASAASLAIWTKAAGYHDLGANVTSTFVQSADGTEVGYQIQDADGGLETAVVRADGTGNVPIARSLSSLEFTPTDELLGVESSGGNQLDFLPSPAFSVTSELAFLTRVSDPTGTTVYLVDSSRNGSLVRTSDATATQFDTGVGAGIFDSTGANLYYRVGAALKHVAVSAPGTVETLVSTGVTGVLAVSPDGKWIAFAEGSSYVVTATTPSDASAPVTLFTIPAGAGIAPNDYGAIFSIDSSYLFFATAASTGSVYSLGSAPTIGGAVHVLEADDEYSIPLFDTRVLLLNVGGNLSIVDAAGKLPTQVVCAKTAYFGESWDNKQVAFVTATTPPSLYVTNVP